LSLSEKAVEERESRVQRQRAAAVPYLLLLPALLALAAISLYPTVDGVLASLHRYRYGLDMGFTGGDNFAAVYIDPVFWKAIGTTTWFVILAVAIETLLGLLLALVVARELRFSGLIRVTLILPMTIAPVVVGVIWRLLYASDIGVVNPLFELFGFEAPNVLAHPLTAFLGLIAVDVWEWTPLLFLIILAGLHSLPQDPIEAARVDGASAIQAFFHHTLPLLRPVLLVAVVLRTIDAVGTFDQIYVLTKGGPGTATQLISIYAYNTAFLFNQYGRAMAMLIGLLACLLLLMAAAVHFMRRSSEIVE
jgi:multiple sugar transport system permease protein